MTLQMGKSTGTCQLCGAELEVGEMHTHLAGCVEEYRYDVIGRDDDEPVDGYHLAFQAKRAPMYWFHVLVRADAALEELDSFIRDVWMEDASKHSRFVIGNRVFSSNRPTSTTPSSLQSDMDVEIAEVVEGDVEFDYAYDLESTTELEGRAVAHRHVLPDRRETPIRLLARNDPPEIPCECGGCAELVCPDCGLEASGWLCEPCADGHGCFENGTEPVDIVNSPRALAHE